MPPHIRKWPNQPNEYVNVADYQERIEPPPSEIQVVPVQGELELVITSDLEQGSSDKPDVPSE